MSRLASALLLCLSVGVYSVPVKNDTVFTSAYAKVAKWGAADKESSVGEGRSSGGQTFFTQRSDASVRSSQNVKPKEVVYHYSMGSNSRVGEDKNEKLPAMGEVMIQDRFHPPPFSFNYYVKKGQNDHHQHSESKPSVVYATPAVSKPPKVDAQPSVDTYSSPVSSYSPVASGIPKAPPMMDSYDNPIDSYSPVTSGPPDTKPKTPDAFPPNTPDFLDYDPSKGKPKFPGYVYNPPTPNSPVPPSAPPQMPKPKPNTPMMDSYDNPIDSYSPVASGPPDSKPKSPDSFPPNTPAFLDYDPSKGKPKFPGYVYDRPIADSPMPPSGPPEMTKSKPSGFGIPKFPGPLAPPPDEDDSKGHDMYMPPSSSGQDDQGPPITQTVDPPSGSGFLDYDHHHHHHHHHPKPGDDADLAPPPSGPPASFPKHVPEYLDHDPTGDYHYHHIPYNFDHHHHVYHEVKTTTEAPVEDMRVNKGHYSYYYLGRKLWYIPLYFSVYFIIYITVLILKSIARHKVNFVHEYDKGKGRSLDTASLDDTTRNVTTAIDNFKKRFLAM